MLTTSLERHCLISLSSAFWEGLPDPSKNLSSATATSSKTLSGLGTAETLQNHCLLWSQWQILQLFYQWLTKGHKHPHQVLIVNRYLRITSMHGRLFLAFFFNLKANWKMGDEMQANSVFLCLTFRNTCLTITNLLFLQKLSYCEPFHHMPSARTQFWSSKYSKIHGMRATRHLSKGGIYDKSTKISELIEFTDLDKWHGIEKASLTFWTTVCWCLWFQARSLSVFG